MSQYINRYKFFFENSQPLTVPFLELPVKATDEYDVYRKNKSRLDKLSQDHYGAPYFGWLIMQANPQYGGLEWDIPDNALLRIPKPLLSSLQDYKQALETHTFYYGK
jgi:hypothetical protein